MTRFRPCIDIFSGKVTQIVGGTLKDNSKDNTPTATHTTQRPQEESQHTTNHTSHLPSSHFARLYRESELKGGHVIMLSTSEESQTAAREACAAWPGEMQVGGGINERNAPEWIAVGAGKVIVTSHLFPNARFSIARLREMVEALDGDHSKLVIDLSCRRQRPRERQKQEQEQEQEQDQKQEQEQQQKEDPNNSTGADGNADEPGPGWIVAMNKWQKPTDMVLSKEVFNILSPYCSEFLVHAADVEGKQQGIDEKLVERLAEWCSLPITYAGGARSVEDLKRVKRLSGGKVDLTIGSALDVFGGEGVALEDCVRWNEEQEKE